MANLGCAPGRKKASCNEQIPWRSAHVFPIFQRRRHFRQRALRALRQRKAPCSISAARRRCASSTSIKRWEICSTSRRKTRAISWDNTGYFPYLPWEFGKFTMGIPFCWNIFCWKIRKYLGKHINWNRMGITKFKSDCHGNILWENHGDIYWNIYIGI